MKNGISPSAPWDKADVILRFELKGEDFTVYYGDSEIEHLWARFPAYAIFRQIDNSYRATASRQTKKAIRPAKE